MGERVVVAMSGGVDSTVAAALLRERGLEPIGLTLRYWLCAEGGLGAQKEARDWEAPPSCCGVDGVAQARAAAGALGIPHYVVDAREVFEREVLRPSWDAYARGETPNPCVLCNEQIKFGLLLDQARKLGAERVATGHYARIVGAPEEQPRLLRGRDREKDQSYFLFSLGPERLARSLFPLGELTKDEVRALAVRLGLPNAERRESQDACLVGEAGFAEELRRRFSAEPRPGPILDQAGRVLGQHSGIHRFTVGQRKGLGVALGHRAWVAAIDFERSAVTLATSESALLSSGMLVRDLRCAVAGGLRRDGIAVQLRYRHAAAPVDRLEEEEGGWLRVWFNQPQRAVTPGQAAVLYVDDQVLGGGWIDHAFQVEDDP